MEHGRPNSQLNLSHLKEFDQDVILSEEGCRWFRETRLLVSFFPAFLPRSEVSPSPGAKLALLPPLPQSQCALFHWLESHLFCSLSWLYFSSGMIGCKKDWDIFIKYTRTHYVYHSTYGPLSGGLKEREKCVHQAL